MEIIDTATGRALSHNGQTAELPALATSSRVHAYETPTGLWIGIQEPGKPRPVYAGSGGVKIGTVELPADSGETLQASKERAIDRLNLVINERLAATVYKYPEREAHTWPTSLAESRDLLADSTAPATLVRSAAAESGLAPVDLAAIIIANGDAFAAASGKIVGQRIKVKGLISAATTEAEVGSALDLL